MAKTVEHEGYTIQSAPHHPLDSKRWQLRIIISFKDHRGDRTREFSADALYAIERGADIHGVTFGQRPIEGKVEDQFVMDMRTEDRRAPPRRRVQFHTTFSAASKLEWTGIMLDLSAGGCRIESPVTVEPGMSLELRIYAPDIEWPLMIEATNVHRVSGQTFGLAFSRITETEQERLGQMISALMKASWYERAPDNPASFCRSRHVPQQTVWFRQVP